MTWIIRTIAGAIVTWIVLEAVRKTGGEPAGGASDWAWELEQQAAFDRAITPAVLPDSLPGAAYIPLPPGLPMFD